MLSSDEILARRLESSGHYKVLRPIPDPVDFRSRVLEGGFAIGVALDIESTGTDHETCDVIELAMVRFAYDPIDGRILGVLATFSALRQPSHPIPPAVVRLTGLDDEAVAGSSIDDGEVERFLDGARFVVAHNASFDRPFAEALWPSFVDLPWACSCTEIDWRSAGFDNARLGSLLVEAGYHHRGHRALNDVLATLHLLDLPLPNSGRSALSALLTRARAPSFRIWAEGAPFAAKGALKARGYRWSDGAAGTPRAWYRDVAASDIDVEADFLRQEIYRDTRAPRIVAFTAMERFSRRDGVDHVILPAERL